MKKIIKEEDIFPEIKQNIKNIPLVKIYKDSERKREFNYIMVAHEKHKKGKKVYDSQWILEKDLEKLLKAKAAIEKYRFDKIREKTEQKNKILKKKEKKFNKIYDENYYPKNKRKECYKYFVLNESIYLKNIDRHSIKYFINEKSTIETKDFIKLLKKEIKINYSKNKDWIIDDFSLKKIEYIEIEKLKEKIKRGIEVLYLQKKEIKKIRNQFKNKKTKDIVDYFYKKRFEINLKKERGFVLDVYNYINETIEYEKSSKIEWEAAFKRAVKKYNKEEALESFVFEYFININKNLNLFSNTQNAKFKIRKKFRNKIKVEYLDNVFLLPVFLDFDTDIKGILLNHYDNNNVLRDKILEFNNALKENKEFLYREILDRGIKKSLKNIIYYSERNYDFKRLSKLSEKEMQSLFLEDFSNQFAKEINSTTDYLKRDLSEKSLNNIEEGIFEELKGIIKNYLIKELITIDYKESFPLARTHKRKVKFYMGETNSGKTYNAFNELVQAKSGIYLSPLRLLALEGQEEIEKRGKICSMLTGEESDIKEGANFKSCTIEMLNINEFVESIVIDEIQMIKDPNRGWAWIQALIGSPANNIILAGSKEVLDMVRIILAYTGDEIEVIEYQRKSPLIVEKDIIKIENIKSGTALIAFSRRKVLELREKLKDRRVSVIYGNLGPEVRKEEARKFREGETEILIATDAIAMGLNLPIETVIFSTHEKSIRGTKLEIDKQLAKQIAGRAGRYGLKNRGYVGALNGSTLKYIKDMVDSDIENFEERVPIMPNLEYLKKIRSVIKTDKMSKILTAFQKYAAFNSELFYSTDLDKRIELSETIDKYSFDIESAFMLSSAPVRENYEGGIDLFEKYINRISEYLFIGEYKTVASPNIDRFRDKDFAKDRKSLQDAEEIMHDLELYSWFANKYENIFIDMDSVKEKRDVLNNFIINTFKIANKKK